MLANAYYELREIFTAFFLIIYIMCIAQLQYEIRAL